MSFQPTSVCGYPYQIYQFDRYIQWLLCNCSHNYSLKWRKLTNSVNPTYLCVCLLEQNVRYPFCGEPCASITVHASQLTFFSANSGSANANKSLIVGKLCVKAQLITGRFRPDLYKGLCHCILRQKPSRQHKVCYTQNRKRDVTSPTKKKSKVQKWKGRVVLSHAIPHCLFFIFRAIQFKFIPFLSIHVGSKLDWYAQLKKNGVKIQKVYPEQYSMA